MRLLSGHKPHTGFLCFDILRFALTAHSPVLRSLPPPSHAFSLIDVDGFALLAMAAVVKLTFYFILLQPSYSISQFTIILNSYEHSLYTCLASHIVSLYPLLLITTHSSPYSQAHVLTHPHTILVFQHPAPPRPISIPDWTGVIRYRV
jgi:hypothetical protein